MLIRILVVACFALNIAQAQDIQYVFAENGLVVREKPNQGAIKVGLLDYGSAVEVVEHTNLNLDVIDNNEKVTGKWVKIKGTESDEFFEEGYVFNGFLTEKKIETPLKIKFDAFTIFIDKLAAHTQIVKNNDAENKANYYVDLGATPENRYIKVKHHQEYKSIKVFQRYQNSISIMNEGPHCDLLDYKHFSSSWKPLEKFPNSKNIFKTVSINPENYNRFVDVNMEELKEYVKNYCGEKWAKLIASSKSINEYPIGVTMSKIELKVVMTDIDGHKTEKIITFELPMGC